MREALKCVLRVRGPPEGGHLCLMFTCWQHMDSLLCGWWMSSDSVSKASEAFQNYLEGRLHHSSGADGINHLLSPENKNEHENRTSFSEQTLH